MISKSKLLRGAWAAVAIIGLAVGANAFTGRAYAHDDDERWEHHRDWDRSEDREEAEEAEEAQEAREAWLRHEWQERHPYYRYSVEPRTYYAPAPPPTYYYAPQPYLGGSFNITIPIR